MNILKLLASESFLTVNKHLARLVGLEAATLFADLASAQVYWDNEKGTHGEYFYRTRDMIEEHTTLSPKIQLKAEKELKKLGLLKVQLKGLPATNHYSIGQQEQINLLNKISPTVATGQDQREQQETTNGRTIKNKEIKNTLLRIDNNKEEQRQALQTPPIEDSYGSILNTFLEENEIEEKKKVAPKKKEPEPIESTPFYFEVTQALLALGEKTGTKYRIPDKKTVLLRYGPYQMIIQRLKEGFLLDDLMTVIESKCSEWLSSEKMCAYLVPNTLFCKKNFENYLIASGIKPQATKPNGQPTPPPITDRDLHDKILSLQCTLENVKRYTKEVDKLHGLEKLTAMQAIYNDYKSKQNEKV